MAVVIVGLADATPQTNVTSNSFQVDLFPNSCIVNGISYSTQADCAFYSAAEYTVRNSVNATVVFGAGNYPTCAFLTEPAIPLYTVNIRGEGEFSTFLNATCSHPSRAVISKKATPYPHAYLDIRDIYIRALGNANSCADLWALNFGAIERVGCSGVIEGSDHMMQIGQPGFGGGAASAMHISDIDISSPYSSRAKEATVIANIVGGRVTGYTLRDGGAGYGSKDLVVLIYGYGRGTHPCAVMPTATAAESSGVITSVTPLSSGSGCVGIMDVQVLNLYRVRFGIDLNVSDSIIEHVSPLVGTEDGAGIRITGGNNAIYHAHPTNVPVGIINTSNNDFEGTECDTISHYCLDFENTSSYNGTSVSGTNAYTQSHVLPGSSTYYFGQNVTNITFGPQGNLCTGTVPPEYHEFITQTGPYDEGQPLPLGVTAAENDQSCVNIGSVVGFPSSLVGRTIVSGSTIALTGQIQHVSGNAAIATITAPNGYSHNVGGCVTLIADGPWTTSTSGNIANSVRAIAGMSYQACYDGSKWQFPNTSTPVTVASGTATLDTSPVSPGTCAPPVIATAPGVIPIDNIESDFNSDPTRTPGYSPGTGGMLTIVKYPSAGKVNFKVCNNTGSVISPGPVTLNWRVMR